jgi:hypothetical protein
VLQKLSKKLLLGVCLCSSVGLLSDSSLLAATVSGIPLEAVSVVDFLEIPISSPEQFTRDFSISVANLPGIDPNLRLTSFTAVVANLNGDIIPSNVRVWSGVAAPGWEVTGFSESGDNPGGYRFNALSPENGIAPGETLGGFGASSSALSIRDKTLQITSVSSTPIPEPTELLGTLSMGAFLGTGYLLKRRSKQLSNN